MSIFWENSSKTRILLKLFLSNGSNDFLSEQNSTLETLWSTVEPVDLVEKAYPNLVGRYLDSLSAKTKKTTKVTKPGKKPPTKATQKKSNKLQELIISDDNEENVDPDKLKKPKKRLQNKDDGKTKSIDKYFKKVKNVPSSIVTPKTQHKSQPLERNQETQSPKIETCSTPLSLTQLWFDFDDSKDEIHDLSDIIQGIVSNAPAITNICGKKLHYDIVKNNPKPIRTMDRVGKDDTTDEFDIIVAGIKPLSCENNTPTTSRKKTKKRPVTKKASSKTVDDQSPTTTPILIKKFFKRNCIDHKSSVMTSSTPTTSPKTSPQNVSFKSISSPIENEANVSYFFGDITDENDAFEKLIDFRNMEDEFCTNNKDEQHDEELQEINDSPPIELSETFDLDNYVPVGANLRKRIAS